MIVDSIFLLQEKPNQYLQDLKNFLLLQRKKVQHQQRLIANNIAKNSRKNLAKQYVEGLRHRLSLFDLLIEKLLKISSTESELNELSNFDTSYTLPYKYLIRDLAFEYEDDKEIQLYESTLNSLFNHSSVRKKRICFLGACSEQLPYKLQNEFQEIYTLEKALTVPLIMHLVNEGKLEHLYEFQLKNVDKESHSVVAHTLKNPSLKNVNHVVGDVQKLPFEDQSMDVFVSHYFSDTLPLDKYIHEIKRCLKSKAHFIHYGPLMYHFNKLDAMYSYEEFKNQIKKYGFEILKESENVSFHCKSKYVNQGRRINNKIFLAQLI